MFIQTETTPDPRTLRFLPGRAVLGEDSVSFADAEAAQRSPLAARLFQMTGVSGVTLGQDFIAVTNISQEEAMAPDFLVNLAETWGRGRRFTEFLTLASGNPF